MGWFSFLSLRGRFLVAPVISIVLALILYFTSNAIIHSHSKLFQDISDSNLPQVSQISQVTVLLINNHSALTNLLTSAIGDPDEERVYVQGREILNELHQLEDRLRKTLVTRDKIIINDIDVLEQIAQRFERYRETTISAIELSTVNPGRAQLEMAEADTVLRQLNELFLILSEYHVQNLSLQAGLVEESLHDKKFVSILTVILILFMIVTALYFSNHLSSELERINQALIALVDGKTDIRLPEQSDKYLNKLTSAVIKFDDTIRKNQFQKENLKLTIEELKNSNERYFSLLDLVPTAIVAINNTQHIVMFNKAAERMFGYKTEEIMDQPLEQLLPVPYRHQHKLNVDDFRNSDMESVIAMKRKPVKALKKSGEEFYIEAGICKLKLLNESLMTVAITDITERKKAEEKILHQAHYDALTNLPNRFLVLDRLAQQLKDAQRNNELVAVIFLDLDDFKKINDTLGHETGDKLLIEAAERLEQVVRSGDTVGRLGGDEFIIMLTNIGKAIDARPVAENLIEQFRKAFKIDERELILTASVGISIFPEDGEDASQLLRHADSAMYHAKELGRNTYSYFTRAMNQEVSRRLSLEEQMHGALDRGEFRLLFQPQMDVASGRIVGVEVLLRWYNTVLGEVFPDEFIPIAEQTGLIVPIGQFVLTQALVRARVWQEQVDKKFTVAVNLSPQQFRDPGLVAFIEQAVLRSEFTAKNLELEITEGVLMSGHAYIDEALQALNQLGVGIAMDDFGTGYSSLSYLRRYPFDVLKIDRSFINDITDNEADRELVNAAIAMAHSLGLKVVAEGVETQAQLQHLVAQGCDFAQGYLFGKPVDAEVITAMLEQPYK